jgi:hypothetical protein
VRGSLDVREGVEVYFMLHGKGVGGGGGFDAAVTGVEGF